MKVDLFRQILAVATAGCLLCAPGWAQPLDSKIFAERNSFIGLASAVTPSVVSIDVEKREVRQASSMPLDDPIFRRFFGDGEPQERIRAGKGSGVIIDPTGLVLTNDHVVSGADDITVTLHDGRQLKGVLVGADPTTDVAVIRVQTTASLPAARIGNSQSLPIGSWLMAVGNPHGLEETVTVGILSGKGRVIGAGLYDDFLQTDAAINPGNSGGGLFNTEGELVGINTAVAGQGIGFAIPIEMAKKVAADLQVHGKVMRGYLGVAIQDLTDSSREALNVPAEMKGALLGQVLSEGPAANSGLQPGDVVVAFDGQPVASQRTLLGLVAQAKVGSTVPVEVWRNGKTFEIATKVAQRPSDDVAETPAPSRRAAQSESTGFRAITLTPELASRFSLSQSSGALIQEVRPGSAAARAGLKPGDIVTQADGRPVKSAEELQQILAQATKSSALMIARGAGRLFIALEKSG